MAGKKGSHPWQYLTADRQNHLRLMASALMEAGLIAGHNSPSYGRIMEGDKQHRPEESGQRSGRR